MNKAKDWRRWLAAGCAAWAVVSTAAVSENHLSAVNATIPDFGISGGAPSLFPLTVGGTIDSIDDLNVRLLIEGGANADLTAYLLFGDDPTDPFAVLLNQISGATSGMDVWLDDQSAYDVQTASGAGILSGTFRPAGPEMLGSFHGLDPKSKTWYLAIADNSAGLESTLVEWELQWTGRETNVPESLGLAWVLGLVGCFGSYSLGLRLGSKVAERGGSAGRL